MESIIKRNIKNNGIALGEIARELSINEDRITAMNNNPEGTPLGRIISTYDHIGMAPVELLRDISNNVIALDRLEPSPDDFLSTRAKVEKVIEEYGEPSNVCRNIIKAFKNEYRYPIIYITGSEGCGKTSMAENLLGAQLKFASRIYERKYRHLLFMSDKRSRIEYNYPFGEYPYRIRKAKRITGYPYRENNENKQECIISLLEEDFTDRPESRLEPVSAMDSQSMYSYVVYSDSPLLDSVNIVCSNAMLLSPDAQDFEEVAKTDAKIIAMADIIVIMLDDVSAECLKLADIIQYALLRWGADMADHVIFAIAKSDRRSLEGEDGINERMEKYSKIIRAILEDLELTRNNPETEQLHEHITDMIVPYSSIYKKNNDKDKADAMCNTDFYKKLHNMVFMALNDVKHRSNLCYAVFKEKVRFLSADTNVSPDKAYNLKHDMHKICLNAKRDFVDEFSDAYNEIISEAEIMRLIYRYDIKRLEKSKLISIVNSRLTDAVMKTLDSTFTQMINELKKVINNIPIVRIRDILIENILYVSEKYVSKYSTRAYIRNDKDSFTAFGSAASIGKMVGTAASVPLIMPITLGEAIANTLTYYAQTNFEKNTARKIVSLYDKHNIKNKFTNQVIAAYFEPFEAEIKIIVDSFTSKNDEKTESFIDKINEALGSASLFQDELDQLTQ